MDIFGGRGTTAAVAQKMRRRWLVAERNIQTVGELIFLEDVFQSYLDAGGKIIQSDVTWPRHGSVHRFLETVLDPLRDYNVGLKQLTASDINGQISDFLWWGVSFHTKST